MEKLNNFSNQLPQHDIFKKFMDSNNEIFNKNLSNTRKSIKQLHQDFITLEVCKIMLEKYVSLSISIRKKMHYEAKMFNS